MGVTVTGLTELLDDWQRARDTIVPEVEKVVGFGCNQIKKDAKRRVTGKAHLPHYPRSINYDVTISGQGVHGEVGPDKDKLQGGLGSYIELGTVHNAPIPHLSPALDAEEPRFLRALEDLEVRLLEGR